MGVDADSTFDLGRVEILAVDHTAHPVNGGVADGCPMCGDPLPVQTGTVTVRERDSGEVQRVALCGPCVEAFDWLVTSVLTSPRQRRSRPHAPAWRATGLGRSSSQVRP